jgi:hypothetical protein
MRHTPQKLRVYETLHSLNQAFEQVLADLGRLRELHFLHRGLVRQFQVVVEETRAWANFELVGVLHDREQDDWTRFGRLRRKWETRYQDPGDAVTAAAGTKGKPAKPAGKRPAKGSKGVRP